MSQANGGGGSDELVARAIRDLIHSVPGIEETVPPETPGTSQPWAETASPSAKSKRPLDAVVTDYAARVAASPQARAHLPGDPHPSQTFYERFGRSAEGADSRRRRRRRAGTRKRRGGSGRGGRAVGGGGRTG